MLENFTLVNGVYCVIIVNCNAFFLLFNDQGAFSIGLSSSDQGLKALVLDSIVDM